MLHRTLTYGKTALAWRGFSFSWLTAGWEELDVLHEPRGKTLKSPSPCLSDSHAGDTGNNNNGWVLTKKKRNRTCPADSKMQVIILFFFFPCGPCYIISDRPLNTYRLMFTRLSLSPVWLFTLSQRLRWGIRLSLRRTPSTCCSASAHLIWSFTLQPEQKKKKVNSPYTSVLVSARIDSYTILIEKR